MKDDPDLHDCTPVPVRLTVGTHHERVVVARFRHRKGLTYYSSWVDFVANAEVSLPVASMCRDGSNDPIYRPIQERPGALQAISRQIDVLWDVPEESDETTFLSEL